MDRGTVELRTHSVTETSLSVPLYFAGTADVRVLISPIFLISFFPFLSFLLVLFQSALQGCNARLNAVRSNLFGSGWPTVLRSVI